MAGLFFIGWIFWIFWKKCEKSMFFEELLLMLRVFV